MKKKTKWLFSVKHDITTQKALEQERNITSPIITYLYISDDIHNINQSYYPIITTIYRL